MHKGRSFPVGKVEFHDLYPMSFTEFLDATGNENLHEPIKSNDWGLITSFKSKYIDLLRSYFYVGGMPEAVDCFIRFNVLLNQPCRWLHIQETGLKCLCLMWVCLQL